ncbi:DeoR/GlpR family DNA-binding transcription regulator [Klebsiella michiganensis]|uniref:DeoR/GlpR family DNA-binding transcription regulator n=1 Tax=Klebsiella michiganensis TaxID=1134687 RepID=UPI000C7DAD78|nr:DeoR/GlpR family DNA-binding transcription regulator [Klebsiella michiganensis]PLO02666.1 DeoR/GlpR transcriptional regulator [Klebsiella michiganensis]PLP29563.1 DeoR/GlpR transcriptional regulator [Klebsiella michiganensis]HED2737460.1 DeoR/GlpR transcriptional regulator [Klebsiella michiganensis]HED2791017.1 DeoR/GlpR transcriptional regulator [Klebsiella michiganensis]HED2793577.1 DeoR/GlpR transcriptional regulator [Klebsiella michiganensis]
MSIYAILQQDKKVVVNDLAEKFGVTKMTIRRDLSFFEKQGIVKTTYGGAYLTRGASVEPGFQLQSIQMADDKHLIGQKAAEQVEDGDTIIIDCGTTPLALAHFIFDKKIMVITNSIPVVNLLKGRKNIKLIVTPGEYEDASQGMVSFSTADFFRHIHADKVFLSTQGVNDLGELTVPEMTDAHVKQALMRAGRQKILLADSSKFGQTFLAGHARLADLDLVISQTGLSPDILSLMQTQNVPLLLADSHL